MRIASVDVAGVRRYGRVEGNELVPIAVGQDPLDLLIPDLVRGLRWDRPVPFDVGGRLHAPLPVTSVRDFITFEQHTAGSLRSVTGATEVPAEWLEAPSFYFTNPHAVVGSGADVAVPPGSELFDFELEVAVVVGQDGRDLSVAQAYDHIAGLTILNDWSARDLQRREMRVGLGPVKGKDSASTLGPVIVTVDELEERLRDDRYELRAEVEVDGRRIGGDSLTSMAWSFAELVAYASRGTWVRRGDVLGSGTVGGGCLAEHWGWNGSHDPPPLQPGDTVTMRVEGIGEIHNRVVRGVDQHPVPRARRVRWTRPRSDA